MKALPFMFEKKISKKSYTTLKPLYSAVCPSVTRISGTMRRIVIILALSDAQSSIYCAFSYFRGKKIIFFMKIFQKTSF
jgi:hypothetical protein